MDKGSKTASSGLGFSSVLCIIFIVLKLVGVISWSWWWVLSPLWIGIIIDLIVLFALKAYLKWLERDDNNRRDDYNRKAR